MKIKFDRTETYNIDGSPDGRRETSKGDVRDLPKHLALSLIDEGAAHPVDHMPSQTKSPVHSGGGWYELSNGEKVQGKDNALQKQAQLDG